MPPELAVVKAEGELSVLLDTLDRVTGRSHVKHEKVWYEVTSYEDGKVGLWEDGTRRFSVAHSTDPVLKLSHRAEVPDLKARMTPRGEPSIVSLERAVNTLDRMWREGMDGPHWLEDSGFLTHERW